MEASRTASGSGPDVLGVAEVADLLGTSRQRASEIVRRPDFPAGRQLKAGPVWQAVEVRAWARTWKRKPGPPPAGSDRPAQSKTSVLPGPDDGSIVGDLPELSGADLETYSALLRVDRIGATLARLYLEAHQLVAGGPAIDPLALAAHDIRDILMKLHEEAATPGESYITVSRTAYNQLREAWEQARESLSSLISSEREADLPSQRFISAVEYVLGVSGPLRPRKGKLVDDFLNSKDPARHLLPQVARQDQTLNWDQERRYFNAIGHHGASTDADTLRVHIESVNRLVLTALRPRPFMKMAELDERIGKAEATEDQEDIAAAVACMTNGVEFDHFFQRITSPIWLCYLRDNLWFAYPPEPVISGAAMSFAAWIPGQYLERVAADRSEDVLEICKAASKSTNPRVRYSLLKSVLAMPPGIASGFAKQASRWAGERSALALVAAALGDLAVHLASGGQCKAALSIARPLLTLDAVPRTTVEVEGQSVTVPHDPVARYEPYEYRKFVTENLPQIVQNCGLPVFAMLSRTLADALSAGHPDRQPPRDLSTIWRPTIEASADSRDLDAMDALIDGLRDAGTRLLKSDPRSAPRIRAELERARWDCHKRILIHLARVHAETDSAMAVHLLMDRHLLNDYAVNHERDLLARDCFAHLSGEERGTYLRWIDEDPDREDLRRRYRVVRPPVDAETYVETSVQSWQRDRLSALATHLPAKQRRQLEHLIKERGEPLEEPPRMRWTYGAESPLTPEELASMTPEEILEYLINWEPTPQPWGPSAEGLANHLQQAIRQNAERFTVVAERFMHVEPSYRRAALAGFREAAASGTNFNWKPILALAEAIVSEPPVPSSNNVPGIDALGERESWTRQELGRLLQAGLRSTPDAIPAEETPTILRILSRLLRDEDPARELESAASTMDMPPLNRGINSVRGHAVELSLDVIRWAAEKDTVEADSVRAAVLHELAPLADPAADSSVGVRAMFGLCLPRLVALDREWFVDHQPLILPRRAMHRSLHDAAWETYLAFNGVYVDVFEVLRQEYEDAVDRLAMPRSRTTDDTEGETAASLGAHLLALYNHGTLTLAEGGLLDRFFRHAPVTAKQHVLSLEARSAYEGKGSLPHEVVSRMVALWDYRIRVAREHGGAALDEVKCFAWAFASGAFDPTWSLEQVNRLLASGVRLEGEHLVAEELVRLCPSHEQLVLTALRGMIRNSHKDWGIAGWIRQAGQILDVLAHSSDPDIVDASSQVRDELGTHGFVRQLQPGQPQDL